MLGQLSDGLQRRSLLEATPALEQGRWMGSRAIFGVAPQEPNSLSPALTRQPVFGLLPGSATPQAAEQAFVVVGNELGRGPERSKQAISTQRQRPRGRLTGPVQVVGRLADIWGLDVDQLAMALDYDCARDVQDLLDGLLTLRGRDRQERVRNLFRIREVLNGLFRDHDVERTWLREPHDQLGGRSVIDLLLTGSMEQMILARRFVEHIAGR